MERILVPQPIYQEGIDYLEEKGYQVIRGTGWDEETIAREIVGCSGMIIRTAKITPRIMDAGKDLKVIGRHGVGTDNIDVAYAESKGIIVTNGPYSNTNAVAESTIYLMLTCANRCRMIHDTLYGQEDGYFVRDRSMKVELKGRTLGIVGLGRIGQAAAQKAYYGFGMRVIGYSAHRHDDLPEYIRQLDDLDEVIQQSDFLSLHVPSNPGTRGMISRERIALMKPEAYLINTARGDVVDETALIEALREGKIAGAALDILTKEPFDKSNELFRMENVFITPHNAAHTGTAFVNMAVHAAQGVHEVLSGQEPTWRVYAK